MQTRLPDWLKSATEKLIHGISTKAMGEAYTAMGQAYKQGEAPATKGKEAGLFWLAYLAARLPATFAALAEAFRRAPVSVLQSCESLLDLGSGPGTTLWAAALACPSLKEAVLVEADSGAARLYEQLFPQAGLNFEPNYRLGPISPALQNAAPADLCVFSYTLGELPEAERAAALGLAWEKSKKMLVLLEPGTPRGFEVLRAARKQLLEAKAELAAPCPHAKDCPMPSDASKWCHFSQRLERSKAAKVIKGGDYGYEDEKFIYMVFVREAIARPKARIIGWPRRLEGAISVDLCTQAGSLERQSLHRGNKKALAAARRVHWGDSWSF